MKLRKKFDELAMLELFCTEPKVANPADGYWSYEVTDESGITLRFGMDVIQQSVQIDLKSSSFFILTFTFEQVEAIEIIDVAKGKFSFAVAPEIAEIKIKVEVELRPSIRVQGYTLKNSY